MKQQLWLILFFSLALGGCAPVDLSAWMQNRLRDFHLLKPAPEARNAPSQAEQSLKKEENLTTLNHIHGESSRDHPGQHFVKTLPRTLNGLLSRAENHLQHEEYFRAGKLYRRISDNLSQNKLLADQIRTDRTQLNRRLELCADRLLERGLLAYRNEELVHALEIWSTITTFHPRHKASQRAIQTTRLQLRNLARLPAS